MNNERRTSLPLPSDSLRVHEVMHLMTPRAVKEAAPVSQETLIKIANHRRTIARILRGEDQRLLVVVGPCSIHDPIAAMEYAHKLTHLAAELADRLFIVMRVYFKKPRTTTGWKGLINDPHLDNSGDVDYGISIARQLLLDIAALGLPAGTEFLDPIIPQYIGDLISWSVIGARTTESQTHREMASGLPMPVGFKNGTDGTIQTAIDAMNSSRAPHNFLGINQEGITSIIKTTGHQETHLILRGGRNGPNYRPTSVAGTIEELKIAHLPSLIMIDCSHGNSGKDPDCQQQVWESILAQRKSGTKEIIGAMIESNLDYGTQPLKKDLSALRYGVSITDACLDWETTEQLLRQAA